MEEKPFSQVDQIGLVILAAGGSQRLGTPKQLLLYQGSSFLRRTAEIAVASFAQPIVVVLGAYAEQLRPEVEHLSVHIVENPQWAEGMGTSVQVGIQALTSFCEQLEAVVLVLCDQPFLSVQHINALIAAYREIQQPIIASEYGQVLGVPALFSRELFPELAALKGNQGAKQVIVKHSSAVFSVPFPDGAIDIDTPQDYELFLHG